MRLFAVIVLLFHSNLFAQYPDIDWTNAGLNQAMPKDLPIVKYEVELQKHPGDISEDELIASIIQTYSEGAIIQIPKGEFYFKKQIRLPSNFIFRGAGIETVLYCELEKEQDFITAKGDFDKDKREIGLLDYVHQGDSVLNLKSVEGLNEGDYLYLIDQDENLVESW